MNNLTRSNKCADTPNQDYTAILSPKVPSSWEHILTELALEIQQSIDLPTILQRTVSEVHQLLGCDRLLLYRFDPDRGGRVIREAVTAAQWSLLEHGGDTDFDAGWLSTYQEGWFSAIADIPTTNFSFSYAAFLTKLQVKANLVVPVMDGTERWGLLAAHDCTTPRQWQIEEVNGLRQIAVHLSIAVRQASLLEQLQGAKTEMAALEHSEATNQALVRSIPDFLVLMKQDGIQRKVINIGAIHCLSSTNDTINGNSITKIMPLEIALERIHLARLAIATGQMQQQEYEFIDRGKTYYEEARISPLKDDEVLVVVRDITDRKQSELALQQSEAQYRNVIETVLEGIWMLDGEGKTSFVNQQMADMLGYTKAEMLDIPLMDFIAPEEQPQAQFYLERRQQGIKEQHPFKFQRKDGSDLWTIVSATPLWDSHGNLIGMTGLLTDITQIVEVQNTLQKVNQQLEERIAELNQSHREMEMLNEIGNFLQTCQTVEQACTALSSLVEPLFPNCAGGISLIATTGDQVEVVSAWGDSLHGEKAFYTKDCWVLRRGQTYASDQDRVEMSCKSVSINKVTTSLCISLIAQGKTLGLFYLSTKIPTALPEAKQILARTVADRVALAIANLRLHEILQQQSISDPLTGLFNRRYLEEIFNQELSRAQRLQHSVGVIMLDIDHFKRFNDTYGHDAGDYVLQSVSNLLKNNVRGSDIACRYGGEEMILILPGSSLAVACNRAEKIREAIANLVISHNGHPLDSLTASFGVASFPHHGAIGTMVIQAADAALYRAKAAGRNQVVVAP